MWIFLFFVIFVLIISSTVKIEINEKIIDSYKKLKELKYLISIKLFNKIKLISFKISNDRIGKSSKIIKRGYRDVIRILKDVFRSKRIKVEKLKLNIKLGTENSALTSYTVAVISSIISIFLAKEIEEFSHDKYQYQIVPLYTDKNELKLSINCIISIKLVHIIYMIYVLMRKDDGKYGRTSNRRTYDNSHEQHKRYGRCRHNYR